MTGCQQYPHPEGVELAMVAAHWEEFYTGFAHDRESGCFSCRHIPTGDTVIGADIAELRSAILQDFWSRAVG